MKRLCTATDLCMATSPRNFHRCYLDAAHSGGRHYCSCGVAWGKKGGERVGKKAKRKGKKRVPTG